MSEERVNHPKHYGGENNPYEAIKVIEDYGLGFCAGNAVKYILRAPHKGTLVEDLRKARWYVLRAAENDERSHELLQLINMVRRWFARQVGSRARTQASIDLTEVSRAHWGAHQAYGALVAIVEGNWTAAIVNLDAMLAAALTP